MNLRYQIATVVVYLIGAAWLTNEFYTHVDEDERKEEPDATTRLLVYVVASLLFWPFLFVYFVWLSARSIVRLAFRKIASSLHHLRALYRLHRLMRAGVTVYMCGCDECARRAGAKQG